MKKDARVELARVVACLLVVGVHTNPPYMEASGVISSSKLLLACLVADGVGVFFIIAGFFLFGNKSNRHVYSQTLRRIVLPLLVLSGIGFFFIDSFIGGGSNYPNLSGAGLKTFLGSLISWTEPAGTQPHLWYLFSYSMAIALYPVVRYYVAHLDKNESAREAFLIVTFVVLLVNDLSGNTLLSLSHHSINSAIPALVLMVWGHLLYSNPKILPLGRASAFVLFVICNMLRFMCQKAVLDSGGNASLLMWYSSFGLVNAVCVVRFCLGCRCLNAAGLFRTAVCYVGSLTYGIYLVHFMVRYYIFMIMQEKVESLFEGLPHFLSVFLFSFSMMAMVFVVTGVLVAIYRLIGRFFCALRRGRKPAHLQEGT